MKLKKSYIISLMLFSGLLFAKPVLAEDAISSDNTPMGHYIEQEQSQEASKENTSDSSTTTPSIRARSFAAVPAANVPSDLKFDDNTLPRKDAVDIASYQSWMTQADFNSLKASGVQSIVVKLTEGTNYTNPYAANQIKMAQNAGLNVAVYHYARLTGANSQSTANSLAIQEAAYFAKVAKSFGLASNTIMIMDCEQPYRDGSGNIIGPNPVTVDWATAGVQFANSLKGNGYSNTKFYTSASWIGTNTATCQMNYNTLGGPKNLWAAQYLYGKPSSSNLQNTQYGAWQYTSQMYYQGTSNLKANAVDTSIDYSNFFASSGTTPPDNSIIPPGDNLVANGIYNISSANRAIDISGGGVVNNSTIQTYSKNGSAAQIWQVTRLSNGYYTFMNPQSGKYLEIKAAATANGTRVNLYQGNGTDAQQWVIAPNSSGGYSILSKLAGKAIDIPANSYNNGSQLQIYASNNTLAQSWSFTNTSTPTPVTDGIYRIKNLTHPLFVDLAGNNSANKTQIQIYSENNTPAQLWKFTKLSNGNYEISNPNSGKCIEGAGANLSNGTKVQLYQRNGTMAQQWIITSFSSGIRIKNANSGKSLDIKNGNYSPNAPLQLYDSNYTEAQQWQLIK